MENHPSVFTFYWLNTKTSGRSTTFTSGETQFLPDYQLTHRHPHKHTHTQYHQGPTMEEKETHFSPVNMKSWMCHSILSAVQRLASADVVYITRIYPPWHGSLSEIGDVIYIMCHLISALRQSSPIWQSAFYEIHSSGCSRPAGWEVPWRRRAHATVQHNSSPATRLSISTAFSRSRLEHLAERLRLHQDNEFLNLMNSSRRIKGGKDQRWAALTSFYSRHMISCYTKGCS